LGAAIGTVEALGTGPGLAFAVANENAAQ